MRNIIEIKLKVLPQKILITRDETKNNETIFKLVLGHPETINLKKEIRHQSQNPLIFDNWW